MKFLSASLFVILFLLNFTFAQESKPLQILEKPRAGYPDGNICVQGVVRVRVQFLASGEIGKVSPVNSLGFGLTKSAVNAAKKIKFQPAMQNGKMITTARIVEYDFGIYEKSEFQTQKDEKAEAIIAKAVQKLGGEKYLQVKSIVGTGNYSIFREGQSQITQSFIDVIVFPDKERTEFKTGGTKNIQTNVGETGWVADSGARTIQDQSKEQIESFKRGMRTSLDYLLRGRWRKEATLTFVGRREASLGKRNNVVKLAYEDGLAVEFEFADDGMPMKTVYKRTGSEGEEIKEEDRFAQFVETASGVVAPFIIDHFRNGLQSSRINYLNIEFNRTISDAIFNKPTDAKELKKDLKL